MKKTYYILPMPAKKTSITAYMVASCLDKLTRLPQWRSYFSDDMLRINRAFARYARDSVQKHITSWLPPRLSLFIMDSIFISGLIQHYLCRKLMIEAKLHKAVANGVKQVVMLGGGLDSLCLRMAAQYPHMIFFEVDLPNTQQTKLAALSHIHYDVPANCSFTPADLSRVSLAEVLHGMKGFNPIVPTLVILEGVLMYLEEGEVQSLFRHMHGLFTNELTVIYGATVVSDSVSHWSVRTIDKWLGIESMKWCCKSSDMASFMAALGYQLVECFTYKQLQAPYRPAQELASLPEEDENYYIVQKT